MDVESLETFEPIADGTRMRWEWEVRPQGAVGRLMMPVMARVLTSRLEAAFANIKRVLEAEAASAARIDERL
jgi:hypothetical protein